MNPINESSLHDRPIEVCCDVTSNTLFVVAVALSSRSSINNNTHERSIVNTKISIKKRVFHSVSLYK
jgi:hypothetical protein